jgi:DNA-binding LacI/PurR family transcriptional regulator
MDVTIKDIARACGVDVSTVSRSLSGSYGVKESTRRKVVEAAKRLKYRANHVARTMATGRSNTYGLMISDIRNPFFSELARGAEDAAYAAGCELILCNADLDPAKQMRYLHSLIGKRVDGIVINSVAPLSAAERAELAEFAVPIVLLNRMAGSSKFSTVVADNREGGALAARHLLGLGHRKIGHITGPNLQGNLNDRTHGFLKAVGKKAAVQVLRGQHSMEGGYELTRRLMEQLPGMTALFAANDAMAFGAIRALSEMGKRIPTDVSLVGFDNVDMAAIVHPPLTTVHQPKYETGKAALEILLNLRESPETMEHRVLGVRLIERESCRRL